MGKSNREVREIFSHFDRDGSGTIDPQEFAALLRALDEDFSDEEIEIGLAAIDRNRNQRIEFEEFLRWWNER